MLPASQKKKTKTRHHHDDGHHRQSTKEIEKRPPPPPSSSSMSQQQSSSLNFLSQLSQRTRAPPPSLPGVIKSLRLRNFMCHTNFSHNFHTNLNFVTGQNGSGKSALLSGILVALGGKASSTSRTSCLKSLIQKGKHTARVAVTLHNEHAHGLLRGYGQEITIERWVNISGSGGYRVKTYGGDGDDGEFKVSATRRGQGWRQLKRNELESILMGLNIQIDNPVAILNQEVARTFLRSKDPKVKFKLFYNGTLLSKLESILRETEAELDEAKATLTNQKRVIMDVRKTVVSLRAKCQKIAELTQIKEQLVQLNGDYLWSLVIDKETALSATSTKVEKVDKEIELVGQKLAEMEQVRREVDEGLNSEQEIRRQEGEVRKRLEEKSGELRSARGELNELIKGLINLRAKLATVNSTISAKEAQITKLGSQVERLKSEQEEQRASEEETIKEEEKRFELEAQKKSLESVFSTIKCDAENFQCSADQARDTLDKLEENVANLERLIEAKKRNIDALMTNNSNSKMGSMELSSMFGPKMVLLMATIKANMKRFLKPPRGPLGTCFTVKDPRYVTLIESVLKQVLDSFVVDNSKDFVVLKRLIDSVYKYRSARLSGGAGGGSAGGGGYHQKTPGIITCAFAEQIHDISSLKAHHHPRVPTIFDLLAVENNDPIVYNALIDCCAVERVLLFKRNEEASRVLKSQSSSCPPGTLTIIKNAYTLQWYKFTPAPHYAAAVMPIRHPGASAILKSGRGRETEIKALQLEIHTLEDEILEELEPTRSEIRAQEKCLREAYASQADQVISMRRQLGEITIELKRHVDKMRTRQQQQCDLSSYYEELDELRSELDSQIILRNESTTELETMYRPRLTLLENSKKELEQEAEELSSALLGFQERRDGLARRRLEVDNVISKLRAHIATLKAAKISLATELESHTSAVEEKTREAREACPLRRNNSKSRTPGELRKEFDALKIRIREVESQLGNVAKLKRALASETSKYKAYISWYTPLNRMYNMLRQTADWQQESFDNLKTHMCRTLTLFFSAMAKSRGYEGRLLIDASSQELYYFVCPDGNSASKTLKAIDNKQKAAPGPDDEFESKSGEQIIRENKRLKKTLVEISLGLSGGERSFATICFVMALWQVMECPFYMLDEFDVFMDAFNRKTSLTALVAHAKKFSRNQFVLFSPLDLRDLPDSNEACVLRMYPPIRGTSALQHSTGKDGSQFHNPDNDDGSSVTKSQTNAGPSTRKGYNNADDDDEVENIDPEAGASSRQRKRPSSGETVLGPQRNKHRKL